MSSLRAALRDLPRHQRNTKLERLLARKSGPISPRSMARR